MTDHSPGCVCEWCHAVAVMRQQLAGAQRAPVLVTKTNQQGATS